MMKILKLTLLLGFAPACLYAQDLQTVTSTGNSTSNHLFVTGNTNKNATGSGLHLGFDPATTTSLLFSKNLSTNASLPFSVSASKVNFQLNNSLKLQVNNAGIAHGALFEFDEYNGGRSIFTLDANGAGDGSGIGTGMDYFSITHYTDAKGVEMGTANAAPINILTSNTPRLTVAANGNVGIGIPDPQAKLCVNGEIATNGAINASGKLSSTLVGADGSGGHLVLSNPSKTKPGEGMNWVLFNMSGGYGNSLQFWQYDNVGCVNGGICQARMVISDNGYVGIGTTKPTAKLSVDGTVLAKNVKVSQAPNDWPDYVFESAYKLPSLHALEAFIQENKHLPEIPSAKEIATDGLDLGELVKLQMKKIEELTLYILEQNKRIEALEAQQKK